ncbi:hypothetical protein C4D60_Mb04t17310 [Musa balbisiana]|uniref:Uncharacterized protein n=1 Tax=Musa balbisiana TaxID=52838 RepID=A0A4S8KCP8_MUSBA|nr:hypothetical protein C4D60_Mb04t17310 [Musa balbisiana]
MVAGEQRLSSFKIMKKRKDNSSPPKVNFGRMLGYYDMDDILMEDEPISVVFQVGAHGCGLLDPDSETNDLHLRQAISVSVPLNFSQKYITFFA